MRVCVLVPAGSSTVDSHLFEWAAQLQKASYESPSHGVTVDFRFAHGVVPVERARNVLCAKFLETDCDKALMLDCDVLPGPRLMDVCHTGFDVAVAPVWTLLGASPERWFAPNVVKRGDKGQLTGCGPCPDAVAGGTAVMCVARRVIEDPRMRVEDKEGWCFRTQRTPGGDAVLGEDFDFCLRAQDLGYTFGVVWSAESSHAKYADMGMLYKMGHDSAVSSLGM